MALLSFWANFGPLVKIWAVLCLLTDQNVSNTIRCLCLVFLDDVAVEILCGGYACVAQLLGHRNNIGSVCQEDRGHRVAEGVGIDMGQTVAGGEVFEPAGNAVRVHVIAVVLGEHVVGMNPSVTIGKLQAELLPLVLP